ncbi:MAG: exo-beta-N-acetylmuramidase NamZ domain-containing protein, partial [Bryobacteraceae bacterium]
IEKAISDNLLPGAVLIVGHDGKIVHRKAYGNRALVPAREAMTLDTIFDAASLTKVIATTSAMAKLVEQGKVRTNDKVTQYLPKFQGGKSDITIRNLMTHFSGLRPTLDKVPEWSGYEEGLARAYRDKPIAEPGTRFIYSDTNFVLLAEIVHVVSGKMLDVFVHENVFEPLGMKDTQFFRLGSKPSATLLARIAPTEIDAATGKPFRGVVHDETARFMGGVTGNAGLFISAGDLARFAQMMLGLGKLDGVQVFSPMTVRKFTQPQTPPDQPILRGLGWDIDSTYSGNRGELFPIGSYGHTGFTGTSIWIDPGSNTYVVLMANHVHPKRGKNLTPLRAKVATIVAASLGIEVPGSILVGYNDLVSGSRRTVARNGHVLTGLDVLASEKFAPLKGKRIGLITNHTGLSREGQRNIDLMVASGLEVQRIFSPEHGIVGKEDHENVDDTRDAKSGVRVVSLYKPAQRRPSPEMLKDLDALVFDMQDVGARFYTYSCTMLYALEAASKAKLPFYILDRPNPITGAKIEGPMLDSDLESFVGCFEMPLRHGLTFGELATMANAERNWHADLHVIKMKGWQRGDWFDSTDLTWVDPSPNMRSLNAAILYPGIAMLEASRNYSVGRGTDAPFEQVGADWIHAGELAAFLNKRMIPGVRVYPTRFTPTASNFAGKTIEGVRFILTDREIFDSVRLGCEMAYALGKLYPGKIDWKVNRHLIANKALLEAFAANEDARTLADRLHQEAEAFGVRRTKFLLY